MRGRPVRATLAPIARDLRAQGLKYREIAERLGVAISTVNEWCKDPDRSKHRERRQRYGGDCVDGCGKRTDGSRGPGRAPKRCAPCAKRHLEENPPIWGRNRIIEAIRAWAEEHGGIPPRATDWNTSTLLARGRHDDVEKFYDEGAWPHSTTVVGCFGSWANAIEAAGFERPLVGRYGRDGEDFDLCAEIRSRYERGESTTRLADEYRASPNTIQYRIRKAGGTLRARGRRVAA